MTPDGSVYLTAGLILVPGDQPLVLKALKKLGTPQANVLVLSGASMTRLYRAEAPPSQSKPIAWIKEAQDASGHTEAEKRWFTLDPEALKWYQQDAGPRARTFYVDVPTDDLKKYRVSNSTELLTAPDFAG